MIFDNFELWYTNLPEGSSAGWKHFFGSAVNCEEIKKAKDWCLVLCIVRNPIDYLMSFWENPHHQILKRRKSIEAFLMDEFYSINEKGEIMEDRNINDPTKRYKDIFEMRATKLRWMYCVLPTLTSNQCVVRMEDVKTDAVKVLSDLESKFHLPRVSSEYVIERRRVLPAANKQWFRFSMSDGPLKENYVVPDNVKEVVRTRLDFEAESLAGYDRESILKRLE